MKFIISFMIMFAIFPILNISCRACDIDNLTCVIVYIIYLKTSFIVTFITFLTNSFIKSKHRKVLQIGLISVLSILLASIDNIIVKDLSFIFWIVSTIILALILLRVYYLENYIFSNVYVFIIVSFIYLACTFIGWQTQLGSPKVINIVLYLIFCISFAILTNRNHLERVVYRRSQNLDSVPKSIFRYNSKLTLILCLIPLPLIVFSNRIGLAVYGIFISTCRGVIYLFSLISRLLAKDTTDIQTIEDTTKEYQPYYKETSNMLLDISTIVFCVLLIFLVYYYHEDIIKKFKEITSDLKLRIVKSLRYEDTQKVVEVSSNEGYTDYIKDIPKDVYSKKSFKKDLKKYLNMSTSTETICFGYSILIKGLNVLNYDIKPFNTITDISKSLDCNEFSNVYLAIRYGKYKPTNSDRLLLDSLLKETLKKM